MGGTDFAFGFRTVWAALQASARVLDQLAAFPAGRRSHVMLAAVNLRKFSEYPQVPFDASEIDKSLTLFQLNRRFRFPFKYNHDRPFNFQK